MRRVKNMFFKKVLAPWWAYLFLVFFLKINLGCKASIEAKLNTDGANASTQQETSPNILQPIDQPPASQSSSRTEIKKATILNLEMGSYLNGNSLAQITVSGTCAKEGESVALLGTVSGTTICIQGSFSIVLDFSQSPDGPIVIFCSQDNKTSLKPAAEVTRSFIKDTTPPLVSVGQDIITNNSVTIDASSSDANGIKTYQWSQQSGPGAAIFDHEDSEDTAISLAADGIYILRLTVTDAAGNSAYDELTLARDTVIPTVSITNPAEGTYINASSISAVTVGGSCSENGRLVTISGSKLASVVCLSGTYSLVMDFSAETTRNINIFVTQSDFASNNAVQATRSIPIAVTVSTNLVSDLNTTFTKQQVRQVNDCFRLQGQVPQWNSAPLASATFVGGVVGDFNNDGHLDFIANDNQWTVRIFLGNGAGAFTTSSFATSAAIFRLSSGDFNEDGKLDLVTGLSTTIYFGDGTGAFPTSIDFANGSRWSEVGDVDGDGHLDLVSVDYAKNVIVTYFGNGDGTFRAAHDSTYPTTALFSPSSIGWGFRAKLGDVNKDGKLDLFMPGNGNWGSLWRGDGAGNFEFKQDFFDDMINGVDIVDIDHDGDMDIIIGAGTTYNLPSKIYTNDGTDFPTFTATWTDPNAHTTRSSSLADFNDDGYLDLLIGTKNQGYFLNLGTSDYKFSNSNSQVSKTTTDYAYEILKGDFNEDGITDYIAGLYFVHLYLSSYFATGSMTSSLINVDAIQPEKGALNKYFNLTLDQTLSGDSTISYSLLDASDSVIAGFSNLTPTSDGKISLSGLPNSVTSFKLKTDFGKDSSLNKSSKVCGFNLSFERL